VGNAPALPAQTPVSFLRGGAGDMFSADCKALLAKAGYDPSWFGSYSHVTKKIKAAKDKCAKYDEAVKKGRKRLPPKPSKADEYLADCESGHLTQNAVYQEKGGRGDPCENLDSAPGHSTGDFPCMPQAGRATQDGGEHCAATVHEKESAGAQGDPGDTYEADQISKDSDDRARQVANDKALAKRNDRSAVTPAGAAEGGSAGGGAQSGGTAAAAGGVAGKGAKKPNEPWNKPLKGKTAGDCINAFRKAGEAAMRAKCRDEAKKNREIADGPRAKNKKDGEKYRAALDQEAEDAAQEAADHPRSQKLARAARAAKARATRAKRADCLATQGDYLQKNGIDGPFDGQVPSNADAAAGGSGDDDFE
jgi:hypothetical protein